MPFHLLTEPKLFEDPTPEPELEPEPEPEEKEEEKEESKLLSVPGSADETVEHNFYISRERRLRETS